MRLRKENNNQPNKRLKLEDQEYVSIRKTWGPPPTAPLGRKKMQRLEKVNLPNTEQPEKNKIEEKTKELGQIEKRNNR